MLLVESTGESFQRSHLSCCCMHGGEARNIHAGQELQLQFFTRGVWVRYTCKHSETAYVYNSSVFVHIYVYTIELCICTIVLQKCHYKQIHTELEHRFSMALSLHRFSPIRGSNVGSTITNQHHQPSKSIMYNPINRGIISNHLGIVHG